MKCPECNLEIPDGSKFCNNCGYQIDEGFGEEKDSRVMDGERKLVTIMFSDMSGYTAMTERLDPEEVKAIMSQIFAKITNIIKSYDGFIERFIGDAVMAVYGVPKSHEDDPIRAVRSAMEIHAAVEKLSPQFEKKIGRPLTMHTGINTGLVVTGDVDVTTGKHGLTGDAINLASRFEGLAQSGEILIGESTYKLIGQHFNFQTMDPTQIKGKSELVPVYKLISVPDQTVITNRLQGVQAELIGRETEMDLLIDAVESLKQGKGSVVSIVGDAGTGKSRLAREFKTRIKQGKVQWREGHAFPYTQNMAYYPLTNLLTYAFQIREGDTPELIKEKVETGVEELLWDKPEAKKYIGGLFSINYAELDKMSPEFWQKQLHISIQLLLEALASRGPTVILFEDLHWADKSFIDLLYLLLKNTRRPVLFLCVYRPSFNLFPEEKPDCLTWPYHEIKLHDLSWDNTQAMLQSLLGSRLLPDELRYFIKEKAEGNPFYLEEVVNSLIETGLLKPDNGNWRLTQALKLEDVPPTIQGVLTARLDRLEKQTKRILQEASVIGRAFFYEVLNRVTEQTSRVDKCLLDLESLDLIRSRPKEQDLEYLFKHALTQEVVYNGLLKKERRDIHERIAIVMEQLFKERLPEFYETLAFHFSRGQSLHKAIDYLMKSAKKSLSRYSVEESHQYYKQAYDLLNSKFNKTEKEKYLLIELLIDWAYVFYYRGYFKDMAEVFRSNKTIAESLLDKSKLGMFYSWYGWAYFCQHNPIDSLPYFEKALQIGENNQDQQVIGYACTWLTWYYLMCGRLDLSIECGERTQEIAKTFKSDAYLYFKSLTALGLASCFSGNLKKSLDIGNELIGYGEKHSNIRSLTMGYAVLGAAYQMHNDLSKSTEAFEKAIQIGVEPFYVEFIRMNLSLVYIMNGQVSEAEKAIDRVTKFSEDSGAWAAGTPAQTFFGAILIAKGQMGTGLKKLKDGKQKLLTEGNMLHGLQCEYILGKVFLQIAMRSEPIHLSTMAKNIGFLVKNIPFAAKKAEGHFNKVIELAEKMGSKVILGSAYLDLGLLYKAKKKTDRANKLISEAVNIFEQCEAEIYVRQAKEALASL